MLIYKGNTVDMFPILGPIDSNEVKLSNEHLTINCFIVGCIMLFGGFFFQYFFCSPQTYNFGVISTLF